jgi:hypothetical protein
MPGNNPYFRERPYVSQLTGLRGPSMQTMADRNIRPVNNPAPTGQQGGGGVNVSGIAGAVGGAASLAGDAIGMANQDLNINTDVAAQQPDQNYAPVYTGGQLSADISNSRPQGATGGEILKGVGTGAGAGAAFGPWGALIGAAVGAGSALIGGGVRKKRQRRARNRAQAQLNNVQSQFNTADQGFRQQQANMQDYYQRNNNNARLYSLYRNQI